MRNYSKLVYVLSSLLLITACDPVPKTKVDIPNPDFDELLKSIKTCDKNEAELVISETAAQNEIMIEDEIASQETEFIDCNNKVKEKKAHPVRHLSKAIRMDPPSEFADKVTYVQVENPRTCTTHVFDVGSKPIDPEAYPLTLFSTATTTGQINLRLTDMTSKLNLELNVAEGKNPLKITYYGKCLKLRENPNPEIKMTYYKCDEAEVLGTHEALLQVNVNRPMIEGVRKLDICTDKK